MEMDMVEVVVALLMIVNGEIKEHRIQESMSNCLKGKRIANRQLNNNVEYQCIKSKAETEIYLGEKYHWRLVSESLVTFMTSKSLIEENYNNLEKMGVKWIDPWEKPLHDLYNSNPCLSPIPSLAVHCANINSVFGISPFINLKNLWENNDH